MAQQLGEYTVIAEDWGLIPSIQIGWLTTLYLLHIPVFMSHAQTHTF